MADPPSRPTGYQEFPKVVYGLDGSNKTVQNREEQEALGSGWFERPDKAFAAFDSLPPAARLSVLQRSKDLKAVDATYERHFLSAHGMEQWRVLQEYRDNFPNLAFESGWAKEYLDHLPPVRPPGVDAQAGTEPPKAAADGESPRVSSAEVNDSFKTVEEPTGTPSPQLPAKVWMQSLEEIWDQIDHELVAMIEHQVRLEINQKYATFQAQVYPNGNAPAPAYAFPLEVAKLRMKGRNEYVGALYQIYCQVWERQGHTKTSSFVRVVFDRALLPSLNDGIADVKEVLNHSALRGHTDDQVSLWIDDIIQEAQDLKEQWQNRIEIETRELEWEQRKRSEALEHDFRAFMSDAEPEAKIAALKQLFNDAGKHRVPADDPEELVRHKQEILDEIRRLQPEEDAPDEVTKSYRRLYNQANSTAEREAVLEKFKKAYPRKAAESHWYQQRVEYLNGLKGETDADKQVSRAAPAAVESDQLTQQTKSLIATHSGLATDAAEPVEEVVGEVKSNLAPSTLNSALERRAAVDAYIAEVLKRTGKRITRTTIWKRAGYRNRTEFERWERKDSKRPNQSAHQRFTQILSEKAHLK